MKYKKDKLKELGKDKDSKEYESWALNYVPAEVEAKKKAEKEEKEKKTKKKSSKTEKKAKASTKKSKTMKKKTSKKEK